MENDDKKIKNEETTLIDQTKTHVETTEVIPEAIEEVVEIEEIPRIRMVDVDELIIDEKKYKILANYREGLDIVQFNKRYSDVLSKYDFIVGDIGFEQLRLKGFFEDERKKVALDNKISTLNDYLYEYCNFGCAYFVLEKVEKDAEIIDTRPAHTNEKRGKAKNPKQQVRRNKRNPNKNAQENKNTQGGKDKKRPQNNQGKTNQQKNKPTPNKTNRKPQKPVNKKTQPSETSSKQPGKRNFTIRNKKEDKS